MVYRPMGSWGRPLLLLGFVVFACVGVWLVVSAVRGTTGPPLLFTIAWLVALAWNAYWWLFRICVEIRIEGPTLQWSAPLRRGEAPLADVVRIRPSRAGRQLAVVEMRDRRPLVVPIRVGFGGFERAVAEGAPQAVIDES